VGGAPRILDRPLAGAGRLAAAIGRRGRWAPAAAVVGLVVLSLIPVLIVGSTAQPADISFQDLQADRIPARTTWFRMTGDLRPVPDPTQAIYTLHDLRNDVLAVTVVADAPLPTGPTQVTGVISGVIPVDGTFATIRADVPAEPARHDPWLLFAIPALLAIPLLIGMRTGYPVVRRDPPARTHGAPLAPGESLPALWSGWIGNEVVPFGSMRPGSVSVAPDVDICQLTITEAGATRRVSARRASPRQRLRICWTGGSRPALAIHAPSADIVVALDDAAARDRLAATLE
jgi:hypothetical protein